MIKKLLLLTLVLSLAFVFTGCNNDDAASDSDAWEIQNDEELTCGAFAIAYYLAETGQIEPDQIRKTVDKIYPQIQFDAEGPFEGYSDPEKMSYLLLVNDYAKEVEFAKFYLNKNHEPNDAERVLIALQYATQTNGNFYNSLDNLLGEGEYFIEIAVSNHDGIVRENLTDNSLHYILTYKKDGEIVSRDSYLGYVVPREQLSDGTEGNYQFCNGGLLITPNK